MRIQYALLLPLAIACASSPREADSRSLAAFGIADQGTFVVALGRDTIAAERFRFGRARLDGEVVTRLRETVRRPYAMTFDASGSPARLEFWTRRPTDTPASPPIQTAVITLAGDTIVMETKRNDSTVTRRIPAPRGTVPLLGQSYASYEVLTRRAVRAGGDSVQIPTWAVGAQRTDEFSIVRVSADTMKLVAPFGTIYARVDAEGRIQGAHALGTTVKVLVTRAPMTDLTSIAMMAPIPQLSPRDTIRTSIGGANFTITYSRPMKRGRVIFGGEIVPWGEVWRKRGDTFPHRQGSRHRRHACPGRDVHLVDDSQAGGVDAHHQQADRPVGHDLRSGAGPHADRDARRGAGDAGRAVHDQPGAEGAGRGAAPAVGRSGGVGADRNQMRIEDGGLRKWL